MSDDDSDDVQENQARIYMRTSAANGLNGNEVEITVEGGDGETTDDIEDTAKERFQQAVEAADVDEHNAREYQ